MKKKITIKIKNTKKIDLILLIKILKIKLITNKVILKDIKKVYFNLKQIHNLNILYKSYNLNNYIIRTKIKQKK